MRDLLRLAWRNIRSRRARSWMTVLGVLIGVTAVVALISLGTGVERSVLKQFEAIGYDVILLVPGGARGAESTPLGGGPADGPGFPAGSPLPSSGTGSLDLPALRRAVPAIADAGRIASRVAPVSSDAASGSLRVGAPSAEILSSFPNLLGGFALAEGRAFSSPTASEAVVGARSASRLDVTLGSTLQIAGEPFRVVGILETMGGGSAPQGDALPRSGQMGTSRVGSAMAGGQGLGSFRAVAATDDAIFIPYERARALAGGSASAGTAALRVRKGDSVTDALSSIRIELARQGTSMTAVSTEEIASSVQGVLGTIEGVLASIAGISLLVGAVGMMNTMYTAVLERKREIGILKAIGATDRQVLGLFLIDSGLMGLAGGALGLGLGAAVSTLGSAAVGRLLGALSFRPVLGAGLILGVLGLSFALGALAGAWPAWNAARLEPVEALSAD